MIIRAIRLNQVGTFSTPVAIEGLSGALDVLAGPNELGKSTLLAAVRRVLDTKYTSSGDSIERLRPYSGGAPTIELDFDAGGSRWRLRKRYLAQASADLTDLGTGRIERGGDVQPALDRLLDTHIPGGAAVLWLDQGFSPWVKPKDGLAATGVTGPLRATISDAISAEVTAAGDSGAAARVAAAAASALGRLVTAAHGRSKTGGALDLAEKRQTDCSAKALAARERATRAIARLDQLAVLRHDLLQHASPQAEAARAASLSNAVARHAAGQDARNRAQSASLAVTSLEQRRDLARAAMVSLARDLASLAEQDAGEAQDRVETDRLSAELSIGRQRAEAARAARETARGASAAIDREIAALSAARARHTYNLARHAADDFEHSAAELGALKVTAALATAARREAAEILNLENKLSAAAPTITVAHIANPRVRIRIGDAPTVDGRVYTATGPLVIDIDGVGRITVAAGAQAEAAELADDLAARRAQLDAIVARAGALSAADLEAREAARLELAQRHDAARVRLGDLAPNGLDALAAECHASDQEASQVAPSVDGSTSLNGTPQRTQAALLDRRQRAGSALQTAAAQFEQTERDLADLKARAAALSERAATRAARRVEILAQLPPPAERLAERGRREQSLAVAEADHADAIKSRDVWRDAAPDDRLFAELAAAVREGEAAIRKADTERIRLNEDAARVEGELAADSNDDAMARAEEWEAKLEHANRVVAEICEERDALALLVEMFAATAAEQRSDLVRPVLARIAPYLAKVWPDADVSLGGDFAISSFTRGQKQEEPTRLSGGTQEQIALLARLGLCRLLAERGLAPPLILDDALVYSDDTRIGAMFSALELAATYHQVIVFTCRERTFAPLGGCRLALTEWRP